MTANMSATRSARTLLPAVEQFLSKPLHKGWIGGREVEASDGAVFASHDPGSGALLARVAHMTPADVGSAVEAAQTAFDRSGWPELPPNERGAMLHALADAVERQLPTIAQIEALDAGKIEAQARSDVQSFVDTIRYFTGLATHKPGRNTLPVKGLTAWTHRLAWGPCGFIFPWNFPFSLIGWGIAPALAAGNTVVIKPAEDTPLSALYLGAVAQDVGIPAGVINVVPGGGDTTGAAVASHPGFRRMSFTGSPEIGRVVGEACARNLIPLKLELGGKGAAVLFDDIDVEHTAAKLAEAITFHAGQVCCDATRWLVHERIYDRFADAVIGRLKRVRVGYQLDASTQMGPLVSDKQLQTVLGYVETGVATGARLLLEGGRVEVPGKRGFYVKPALLAGGLDNVAAREEIFGPVAYVTSFETEDEAIRLVNSTEYGLANSVWSEDSERCVRVAEAMRAGTSWINTHNTFEHGVPYGGIGKSGLGGGVNSPETLSDYWRSVSVVRLR